MKLDHPNIIKAYELKIDALEIKPSGKKSLKTFMTLELAHHGEMFGYVQKTGAFCDEICRFYFK